ncbi:MAG: transposase [Candidatus Rokubacteria bacterium]|nr:transposase [Candidatus Rokubacteria bacterium]
MVFSFNDRQTVARTPRPRTLRRRLQTLERLESWNRPSTHHPSGTRPRSASGRSRSCSPRSRPRASGTATFPGSPARQLDIGAETLRTWVRQAEVDRGSRPGLTSEERERLKDMEREVKELRRANEILRSASAFFAAELDRRPAR